LKKKLVVISAAVLVLAAIAGLNVFHFFRSTISIEKADSYCASKSLKHAKTFDYWVDSSGESIAYLVAEDANAGKAQELYIFQRTCNRLKPLANSVDSTSEDDVPVGVYRFYTYDKSGKDKPLYSLILFSANNDDIYRIVYTLSTNGIKADIETTVALKDFVKIIPNLGTINNITTQVTHIKFYSHYNERLVYECDSPFSP